MKKGDIIEVDIESSGMNGEGVARYEGMVVFVPYTLVGERVRAMVGFVKKSFATARAIKMLQASDARIKPVCDRYFKCGGCDLMHVTLDEERRIKIAEIEKNLMKIGGIERKVDEFIDSPMALRYRNKVQLPFGRDASGRIAVGYFRPNSHDFVPSSDCALVGEFARPIVDAVLSFVNEEGLSVYDENAHIGLLRHLIMRRIDGKNTVTIVINGEAIKNVDRLAERLEDGVSLFINVNKARTNVIASGEYRLVKGEVNQLITVSGVKAALAPDAFMQINDGVRDRLYADAIDFFDGGTAIDLYSGIGITTNMLAKKCDRVYSIELVKSASENARETARINGNASKIEVICGDAALEMPRLAERVKGGVGVLLDPPRKGADERVLEAMLKLSPDRIVYISCNHATLSRDMAYINRNSRRVYTVAAVKAYNMFPRTHHVETLVCLEGE